MSDKEELEQLAFDLVVNNMRMTTTNSERTFAMFMLGYDIGEFATLLLRAWTKADSDNQQRLAIAFPQIANAMIKYNDLCSDKKKQKYLKQLIGE